MKVGILSPGTPETIGGGFTFDHEIFARVLERASSSKHEFVVFEGSGKSGTKSAWPDFKHVPLIRPRFSRDRGYPWEKKWIADILNREGIEFFLNTSFETITVDIPFLVIVLDLQHRLQPFFPEVSADGVWKSRENFFSQSLKRAAFIIVGTHAGHEEVKMFYGIPEERIRILSHPTPQFALEKNAAEVDLSSYQLPRDYVFYPAQFWSHKNHAGLVHAIHHLKQEENLRLPVVFTGSDHGNEKHVRQLVRSLQLEDQVHFLGHVPRQVLRALYQNAVALCYVSFFGPENLPPLEAFALGCPVIAADVPGASEQLGDAAVLVDPAKELEIAGALKSLMTDKPKRETLIQRGKERAIRCTGTDFAQGLFDLLDQFQAIRRCWPA